MTFGPYKLLNVRVDSGSLVLDLGDQNDQAVYHPRRFLSFGDSERIQEEATKLIGSMVVTETANEAKNSPKIWWKSVRKYSELTLKPPPVQARFIRPIPKLVLPSPTIDAEQSVAQLTAKAQAGDSDSQFKLGEIYDAGKGVPRSLGKAMDWYQRAAAQGHSLARKVLGIEDTSSADMAHAPVTEDKHVTKIYGPPGTGKTSALLKEVKDAIAQGISPDMIGFFSFTNKATDEAKARMVELFPQFNIESDFPYFRTIHSLANQSLRTRVKVISDKEAIEFDRGVIVERPFMREGDESSQVVRVKHPVLDAATTARSLKVSFEKYLQTMARTQRWPLNKWLGVPRSLWTKELSELGIRKLLQYEVRYEEYKRTLGVIDFADMLDRALIDRMALPELKLLLVDEAQDLSPVQWDLVRALIAQSESCFIAGDDDQAICESFGASATEFIDLPGNKEFETILDASRRVPPAIHTALKPLIARLDAKFPRRTRKTWKPKDDGVEGSGQCGFIKNSDLQAMCRAETGGGSGQCGFIKSSDMQAACRAKVGH
ncbi:MAG: hypothetical protein D4R79_13700 [Comamonadaceae bacterium]|nr:MAG: hypothetical protein D4R79_13700 [Comamonadaceae bacterium]